MVQGEKQFDLVVRLEQQFRDNPEEIGNILVATPGGQQIPLKEFADIQVANGASFIYREDNSRYIGVQFSVEGRDLAGAVDDALQQVKGKVPLPEGYRLDWGGEYTEYTASRRQLNVVLPLTLFLIFLLLFALYRNFKFPLITVLGVVLSAPVGGIVALWLTRTPFSVSSGIGFLALFGVSVQTAVVYISYVNELRRGGTGFDQAIREGAILRLRPIMMTALVAALGLLPAAMATGVGTDSQRPFALVIVSGLFYAAADQRLSHAGALCSRRAPGRSAGGVIDHHELRTAPRAASATRTRDFNPGGSAPGRTPAPAAKNTRAECHRPADSFSAENSRGKCRA